MPNEQMASYWSEQAGPEWVSNEEVLDHMLDPFGSSGARRPGAPHR